MRRIVSTYGHISKSFCGRCGVIFYLLKVDCIRANFPLSKYELHPEKEDNHPEKKKKRRSLIGPDQGEVLSTCGKKIADWCKSTHKQWREKMIIESRRTTDLPLRGRNTEWCFETRRFEALNTK